MQKWNTALPCIQVATVTSTVLIEVSQLRVGMFVQLDMSWVRHPFPANGFRLTSLAQIDALRDLGLVSVRYVPAKSVLQSGTIAGSRQLSDQIAVEAEPAEAEIAIAAIPAVSGDGDGAAAARDRDFLLLAQHRILASCERRFSAALGAYRQLAQAVEVDAAYASATSVALVADCIAQLLPHPEIAIHLLLEGTGERSALHPVNVMVLCLLLGKVQGMDAAKLQQLGLAALLHDLGKLNLPIYLAQPAPHWSQGDRERFEGHVGASVALAERMQLPSAVLTAIAQHHEMADGTGFPLHLLGEDMAVAGKILALVNRYDNLCNPPISADALTPHEALSVIFAQFQAHFDPTVLNSFIRMLGVYPPGSFVQLLDDSYALVVSVNASRPLCPGVIIYQPHVPRQQALVLQLENAPAQAIRRSLRPAQMPRDALAYLSPRQRISYFFARVSDTSSIQEHP